MEQLVWSQEMALGIPGMDSAHQILVEEIAALASAPEEQFGAGFYPLISRLEQDFREEEELMEQIDFPALHSHREQHARVLSGLHHVVPLVMNGDLQAGVAALDHLQEWFLFHLSTMDLALAVAVDLNEVEGKLMPDMTPPADARHGSSSIR